MSYLLQICHPNEIFRDGWKTIEEMSSIQFEYIESPSFEIYPGLIVRFLNESIDEYVGIYGDSHCVDVSQYSKVSKQYNIQHYHGLIHYWIESNDVSRMMDITEFYIPIKTRIEFLLKFLPRALELTPTNPRHQIMADCLLAIQQWYLGECDINCVNRQYLKLRYLNDVPAREQLGTRTILQAMNLINEQRPGYGLTGATAYFCAYAISELDNILLYTAQTDVADAIRRDIPFYDIAVGIGNSKP